MEMIIFSLPQDDPLATILANKLKIEKGIADIRDFPDGETYVRIDSDVKNKSILLICSLDHPNDKFLPLLFTIKTLKQLGAKKICLVSPYLPYFRQDKQFKPGEAITSVLFAECISGLIDELITIDPHLHRIKNISDIYSIPTTLLHAIKPISEWIQKNVISPLIIGPDEESAQWVISIAKEINAPYMIVKKTRYGDKNVVIEIPEITDTSKTPVLVDDIISTGSTMCAVIQELLIRKLKKPICIGVHALFNQAAQTNMLRAGAQEIISCNTIRHPSNKIDITDIILEGIKKCYQ